MEKIISLSQIDNLVKQLKNQGKTIVLVGGCFDLLHFGHIKFLEKAKKQGNVLVVALENDENIKRLKGKGRPIHSQEKRAEMVAALEFVNLVICLPLMKSNRDYFDLVKKVKPDVIAVTKDDLRLKNKEKQAKEVRGEVKVVVNRLKTPSTREIIKLLNSYL